MHYMNSLGVDKEAHVIPVFPTTTSIFASVAASAVDIPPSCGRGVPVLPLLAI